jgi:hypothetical protein
LTSHLLMGNMPLAMALDVSYGAVIQLIR